MEIFKLENNVISLTLEVVNLLSPAPGMVCPAAIVGVSKMLGVTAALLVPLLKVPTAAHTKHFNITYILKKLHEKQNKYI